jgi:hypothetical protein
MLKNIWASKEIWTSIGTHLHLLCKISTLVWIKITPHKIETFIDNYLKHIFNIKWPEKTSYAELWQRAGQNQVYDQWDHEAEVGLDWTRTLKASYRFMRQALTNLKIVALWKIFVDRSENYSSNRLELNSCIFIAHKNVWALLHLYPHTLTQSAQKKGIKIFSRHLSTNLISLLINLRNIFKSTSEIQTVEMSVFQGKSL